MKKRNANKGFSLVELIVVVLIMAIIAVVLAPQVSKWVKNSRDASDMRTMESFTDFAHLAMTDAKAYNATLGGTVDDPAVRISIQKDHFTIKGNNDISDFVSKFAEVAGIDSADVKKNSNTDFEIKGIRAKNADTDITIDIVDGKVAASSNITNTDLELTATNTNEAEHHDPGTGDPDPGEDPDPVKSLSIPSVVFVKEGGKTTIEAVYSGYKASDITWSSSDNNVIKCNNSNGATCEIEAKGSRNRSSIITAKVGTEISVTCTVTVTSTSTLSLNYSEITLNKGQTFVLKAFTDGGQEVSFPDPASLNGIVSLSGNTQNERTVKAEKVGIVDIVVGMTTSSRTVSCKVTVVDPDAVELTLDVNKKEIEIGDVGNITLTITPESAASLVQLTIESGDCIAPDFANRKYTATKEGTVKIVASIPEKNIRKIVDIRVVKPKKRTISHYLGSKLIYTEEVTANSLHKYDALVFSNLELAGGSKTSFDVGETEYRVDWKKKANSDTKFGGEFNACVGTGNWAGTVYFKSSCSIKLDSVVYPVCPNESDLKDKTFNFGDAYKDGGMYQKTTVGGPGNSYCVLVEWKAVDTGSNGVWKWEKMPNSKKVVYIGD